MTSSRGFSESMLPAFARHYYDEVDAAGTRALLESSSLPDDFSITIDRAPDAEKDLYSIFYFLEKKRIGYSVLIRNPEEKRIEWTAFEPHRLDRAPEELHDVLGTYESIARAGTLAALLAESPEITTDELVPNYMNGRARAYACKGESTTSGKTTVGSSLEYLSNEIRKAGMLPYTHRTKRSLIEPHSSGQENRPAF